MRKNILWSLSARRYSAVALPPHLEGKCDSIVRRPAFTGTNVAVQRREFRRDQPSARRKTMARLGR